VLLVADDAAARYILARLRAFNRHMKLWVDTDGREIVAQGGHIPLALALLPGNVVAPLQRAYDGEDFTEQIYEAMFQRGYLHVSITGHTIFLQQPTVATAADLPPAQQSWIEAQRLAGQEVRFNGGEAA